MNDVLVAAAHQSKTADLNLGIGGEQGLLKLNSGKLYKYAAYEASLKGDGIVVNQEWRSHIHER
jgi:hypothetical protein